MIIILYSWEIINSDDTSLAFDMLASSWASFAFDGNFVVPEYIYSFWSHIVIIAHHRHHVTAHRFWALSPCSLHLVWCERRIRFSFSVVLHGFFSFFFVFRRFCCYSTRSNLAVSDIYFIALLSVSVLVVTVKLRKKLGFRLHTHRDSRCLLIG